MTNNPIAVLDSGAGGLSVVRAIRNLSPLEDIYYFADTKNLPYGIKSPELIKKLALDLAKKAVEISNCRLLVIACHTISVTCLNEIQKSVNVPVIGMVDPSLLGLKELLAKDQIKQVGVISTKATVLSGVYKKLGPSMVEHAAGPLVSLVEDSDLDEHELTKVLQFLLPKSIKECDALLIGCTHFSALIDCLKQVLKPSCFIVDAADILALMLKNDHKLFGGQKILKIFVSDNPERFQITARRFMKEELSIRSF